jgi:mono/diheme cytochrome c family protein
MMRTAAALTLATLCGCSLESPPSSVRTVPLGDADSSATPSNVAPDTHGTAGTGAVGSAGSLEVPLFERSAAVAGRARPISGGSLFVTRDGATAVAADPDRDEIYLVELATRAVRVVTTAGGDEPSRAIEGPDGTAFVAARAGSAVLAVNLASGTVTRQAVCGSPRGLSYDAAKNSLHVACSSGALVTLDAATLAVTASHVVASDLRDVIVRGDELVVTRFRNAELLVLDEARAPKQRRSLAVGVSGASAAFRAVQSASGFVTVVHHSLANVQLGGGFGAYYGAACAPSIAAPVLSTLSLDGRALPQLASEPSAGSGVAPESPETTPSDPRGALPSDGPERSVTLPGLVGPFDLALSPDGTRLAILASGNAWPIGAPKHTLALLSFSAGVPEGNTDFTDCGAPATNALHNQGEPVAVAFDASGRYVVQSREPATLELEDGSVIELSASSRFDTGLALFHMNSGANIACASCHPDGGEDGHTWSFFEFGLRRSQGLEGGGAGLAPFHWQGELATFESLFEEVMLERMSMTARPSLSHIAALREFIAGIPAPPGADGLDAAAVERGRQLFDDLGCGSCHAAPRFTDDAAHDVGSGGEFVTPSLIGVHLRAPLMHDGCAPDLKARFGPCGGDERHGSVDTLPDAAIDDLVSYLRSL